MISRVLILFKKWFHSYRSCHLLRGIIPIKLIFEIFVESKLYFLDNDSEYIWFKKEFIDKIGSLDALNLKSWGWFWYHFVFHSRQAFAKSHSLQEASSQALSRYFGWNDQSLIMKMYWKNNNTITISKITKKWNEYFWKNWKTYK